MFLLMQHSADPTANPAFFNTVIIVVLTLSVWLQKNIIKSTSISSFNVCKKYFLRKCTYFERDDFFSYKIVGNIILY